MPATPEKQEAEPADQLAVNEPTGRAKGPEKSDDSVLLPGVKLTPFQREKFYRLGGAAWLRSSIMNAAEPPDSEDHGVPARFVPHSPGAPGVRFKRPTDYLCSIEQATFPLRVEDELYIGHIRALRAVRFVEADCTSGPHTDLSYAVVTSITPDGHTAVKRQRSKRR